MLVDTDGDGDLGDEVSTLILYPAGALFIDVIPQADGTIIGRATAISGEANWSGFQLFRTGQVVATEKETWGSVKALYRP